MAQESISLGEKELRKLTAAIKAAGLQEVGKKSRYELLRVKDEKTSMILYSSGKVVHDGSERAKALIDSVLSAQDGYDIFLGSDETGKGEWYGPLVVVCCALLPEQLPFARRLGVRDSKSISSRKVGKLAYELRSLGARYRSVVLMPDEYNRMYERYKNLNELLAWAHAKAIKELLSELEYEKAYLVVDKFDEKKTLQRLAFLPKKVDLLQKTAGEDEIAVAAASVFAKAIFERRLSYLNDRFGLDLKAMKPSEVSKDLLPQIAKLHFKNVS